MGLNIHFLDNAVYTTNDFCNVFARLTSQGVSLYKNTGTLIKSVKDAVATFVSPGVDLYNSNACNVTVTGGIYSVSEGVIWFSDGKSIKVDGDGYELEITKGAIQYIYAQSQPITNSAAIVVSTTAGGVDSVPLATIAADGTITDTRIFATTKVAPCTANIVHKKSAVLVLSEFTESTQYVEIGFSGFSKFLYQGWVFETNIYKKYADLTNGEYQQISFDERGTSHKCGYVKKAGSGLIFKNKSAGNGKYYNWSDTIEFEVV